MDDLFKPITLPIPDAPEINPTGAEIIGSAFFLENDVANLYAYMNRPAFEPDLNFDFQAEFKKRQLPLSWKVELANARSGPELDAKAARLTEEYKAQQVLAAGGWTGTVAALGAGMLSPTAFIPFVGQARGAKGVAQMLALAAAGATAQNASLYLNQDTMTEAELLGGVAMDTLLMGMMGGAYLGLTREAKVKLQRDMRRNEKKVDVPQGPGDVARLPVKPLLLENLTKAEVKEEVISEGIREPSVVAAMLAEAPDAEVYVPLRDRALAIETPKRRKAKDGIEQSGFGGSWLEAKVAEGVTARFIKATGGTKFFVGGEYAISLHLDDGTQIRINQPRDPNKESSILAGRTNFYKQKELIDALAAGELDDQLYKMLEAANEGDMAVPKSQEAIPNSVAPPKQPEAWDLKIIDDLKKKVERLRTLAGDRSPTDTVRDTIGDSRPETVRSVRERIAKTEQEIRDMEGQFPDYFKRPTNADGNGSLSAASSKTRNTLGAAKASNKVRQAALDALGRMSPAYRMLTQPLFASLRHAAAMMDTAGVRQAGLDKVKLADGSVIDGIEPSAKDGLIIERIRGYDPYKVQLFKALDQHFYNYVYDGKEGFDMNVAAFTQLRSQVNGLPPGKVSWQEFKRQVFEQLNTGEVEADFAPAVEDFRKFFAHYNERHKQYLKEMGLDPEGPDVLYKELLEEADFGKGVTDYAHHIPDANKIIDNLSEFINDFAKLNEAAMEESYAKMAKIFEKKRDTLRFEQEVAGLDEAEIVARMEEVESDIVFIDELPELVDYKSARLDLNREAKEQGWTKEELKTQQADLLNNLSADAKQWMEERKRLMKLGRLYKRYGAKTTEKVNDLQAQADKLTDGIADMFRNQPSRLKTEDLALAKTQTAKVALLKKATKDVEKALAALEKRRAQLAKLTVSKRQNSYSRAIVQDYLDKAKVRYDNLQARLDAASGQAVALDARLSEINLVREDVIADITRLVRSKASRAEDLEAKAAKEAENRAPLTPEEKAKAQAQIGEELDQLEIRFQQKYGVLDPETERPNFRDKSVELATLLAQRLTNTEVELSPAYHALRQDARGAELLRMWKAPFNIKKKWLINDVELIASAYDRVMAPDLEIWRAFGSPNGSKVLGEMQDELTQLMSRMATAKYVKLPAKWVDNAAKFSDQVAKRLIDFGASEDLYLTANSFSDTLEAGYQPLTEALRKQIGRYFVDETKAQTYNFDVAIQRLRAQRGVPRDANSFWWRAGRFAKNLNVLTMMGMSTISSLSDVARPVWTHGPAKVFKHGWAPFLTKLTANDNTFRLKSREINRRIGLNLEPWLHSRAQGLFDLAEDSIGKSKLERGVNVLTQKMGLVALYDFWTAGMKTIAGNVTHATMAEYIPAVAKQWRAGGEFTDDLLTMRTYLRRLGLSDVMLHRIALQMESPDGVEYFSNGGVLPNVHLWGDLQAFQAYQAAVLSEVNRLIVTPGLERPNFVDENLAFSMLTQFKSFTFASNSRMVMSSLQGNDPYVIQGVAMSLAIGAISYYLGALATGGAALDKANEAGADTWFWEATKRSGILGAISIGTDAAEELPWLTGDETPALFRKPSGLLGTVLGPTYSQAIKMAEVATTLDAEDQERNMRKIRQVFIPYQNLFYFRRVFDAVGSAMFGGEK